MIDTENDAAVPLPNVSEVMLITPAHCHVRALQMNPFVGCSYSV